LGMKKDMGIFIPITLDLLREVVGCYLTSRNIM